MTKKGHQKLWRMKPKKHLRKRSNWKNFPECENFSEADEKGYKCCKWPRTDGNIVMRDCKDRWTI